MDPVEAALDDAFPDREIGEVGATGPSWNEGNETVRVGFKQGSDAYLKIALDGDGTRLARERAVAAYVRSHTDVPVPETVTVAPDADPPYLVTVPVVGDPLVERWDAARDAERRALASAVGSTLARLHELRFDGHGRFVGSNTDALDLEPQAWPDLLAADIEYMREAAPSPRFPSYYDDLLAAVEANRHKLRDVPAALLHGDPARPNSFVTGARIGLLDWERAHAGDPVRELCRARDQQFQSVYGNADGKILDAFYDGYRSVAGSLPDGYDERRPIYEAIRLTGPIGFFDNYLDFDEIVESELAEWLDTERERRLAALE